MVFLGMNMVSFYLSLVLATKKGKNITIGPFQQLAQSPSKICNPSHKLPLDYFMDIC